MTQLKDRSLLVKMTRGAFNANVRDINAAAVVDKEYHSVGAGKFYKSLFKDNKKLRTIQGKMAEAYSYHTKYSAPWMDGGIRIISSEFYEKYIDDVGKIKNELEIALRSFGEDYDAMVEQDIERLGELANRNDYPPFSVFAAKFQIKTNFFPVPESNDFRFEVKEEVKSSLDEFHAEARELAAQELSGKMRIVLNRILDQCSKEDPRIFDSMLGNTKELAEIMGIVNVYDDPQVKEWSDKLETLANSTTTFELRTSALARREMLARTKKLLEDVGSHEIAFESPTEVPSNAEVI